MSPEDVLEVFCEWQGFVASYDLDNEPEPRLTFDSPVAHWEVVCRLPSGKKLGRYLNRVFRLTATDKEWQTVLSDAAPIRVVCEFISKRMTHSFLPDSEGLSSIGVSNGQMFRALRGMLSRQGILERDLGPSTPLEPFVIQHFEQISRAVAQLAPGSLPDTDVSWKKADPISVTLGFAFIYVLFQVLYRYSASVLGSAAFTIILCLLLMKLWDRLHALDHFKDIETFGDLTRLMVERRRVLR